MYHICESERDDMDTDGIVITIGYYEPIIVRTFYVSREMMVDNPDSVIFSKDRIYEELRREIMRREWEKDDIQDSDGE